METNHFTVRRAAVGDMDDILRFNQELFKKERSDYDKRLNLDWTYGEGREAIEKAILDPDSFMEVAQSDGKVVGYSFGEAYAPGRYSWRIGAGAEFINLYIEPGFRGKGLGSSLAANFGKWCKQRGIDHIEARAYADNKASESFAEKIGAKKLSTIYEKDI